MPFETRVTAALGACCQGLRLARREGQGVAGDPVRWGWVTVGISSALQAALVAGLSGYETARDEDVIDPSNPDRMAPIALLLRRARASNYLNPPERLELPASVSRRVERVLALRNATLHGLGGVVDERIAKDVAACLDVITHLMIEHPSFDIREHGVILALIRDEINAVRRQVSALG